MNLLLAAALLLHPAFAADGHLRLVAVGTGDSGVAWTLDGVEVAHTGDGQAASVPVTAGGHELWATSAASGRWRALARPETANPSGAVSVPAWTAVHEPEARHGWPPWMLPAGMAVAAVGVLVRPRMLLQALRRARSA